MLAVSALGAAASQGGWLGVLAVPGDGGDSELIYAGLGGEGWALLLRACGLYWGLAGSWEGAQGPPTPLLAPEQGELGALAVAPWGLVAGGSDQEGRPLILVSRGGGSVDFFAVEKLGEHSVKGSVLDLAVASDGSVWALAYARLGVYLMGSFNRVDEGLLLLKLGSDGVEETLYYPGWPPEGSVDRARLLAGPKGPIAVLEAGLLEGVVYVLDVAGGAAARITYVPEGLDFSKLLLGGAALHGDYLALALTSPAAEGYDVRGLLVVLRGLEPLYTALLTGPPVVEAQAASFTGGGAPAFALQTSIPERGALSNYILVLGPQGPELLVSVGSSFTLAKDIHVADGYTAIAATYEVRVPVESGNTRVNVIHSYAGIALAPLDPEGEGEAITVDSTPLLKVKERDPQNPPFNMDTSPQGLAVEALEPPQPQQPEPTIGYAQAEVPQPSCEIALKPLQKAEEPGSQATAATTTTTETEDEEETRPTETTLTTYTVQEEEEDEEEHGEQEQTDETGQSTAEGGEVDGGDEAEADGGGLDTRTLALAGLAAIALIAVIALAMRR